MSVDTSIVYALVMGGGVGRRLFPLTKDRAKPAVPLAGKYRLIDVPISNCINSKIGKIFVLTQFNTLSLHQHIHNAYRFDLFSDAFVEVLAAEQTTGKDEWYQGTADAVRHNLWHLTDPDVDRVLVLSGDQMYRMDFRDLMQTHEDTHAELTIAATVRRPETVSMMGVLRIDRHFRIVDFIEKPTKAQIKELTIEGEDLAPLGVRATGPVVLASMGIYMFNRNRLEFALDNEMPDFGKDVIPWSIKRMRAFVHPHLGYWEDVGTIRSFFDAHMALTMSNAPFRFQEPGWPIYTRPRFLPATSITGDSRLSDAIVSEGCCVEGAQLSRVVIGLRSQVNPGAVLTDVIMMGQDSYETAEQIEEMAGLPPRGVGKNCHITRAILDRNARIGEGVVIASHEGKPDEDGDCYYVRDGVVIIPKNGIVPDGRRI
jgi:glucose-1-phosphate adenylyltransferase